LDPDPDALAEAAVWALRNDIEPHLSSGFAKSRVNDADVLVRCLEMLHRYGPVVDRMEREELGALLGRMPATTEAGLEILDGAIKERRLDDERVLRYLANRAYRREWLYGPASRLYPNRRWAALS